MRQMEGGAHPRCAQLRPVGGGWDLLDRRMGGWIQRDPSRTGPHPALGSAWTQVPEPVDGVSLYDVTAVSPTDAWAVGRIYDVPPLIMHWDGTAWQQSPTPIPGTYIDLYGVSAVSSTDVWAVGTYTDHQGLGRSLNMHWDGTEWSVVHAALGVLYGVSALSADDVWAVGYSSRAPFTAQPLIEHWDGATWSVVPAAPPPFGDQNELEGVAAVSSDDVWAVGIYGFAAKPLRPLAEHWDGTSWSLVQPPVPPGGNFLLGVAASSFTDVWAVGRNYPNVDDDWLLTMHWDGTAWKSIRLRSPGLYGDFQAVTAVSSNDAWAAGSYFGADNYLHPLLEHSRGCASTGRKGT